MDPQVGDLDSHNVTCDVTVLMILECCIGLSTALIQPLQSITEQDAGLELQHNN